MDITFELTGNSKNDSLIRIPANQICEPLEFVGSWKANEK